MADGVAKASQILSMTRESEFLQSFLRVGLDSEPEETSGGRSRRVAFKKAASAAVAIMASTPEEPESPESQQPSPEHTKMDPPTTDARRPRSLPRNQQQPQPTTKKPVNTFTQIMREIKLRSMKKTPNKKSKGRQHEEVYTDKDRAAAVIIGGDRDIKTSLKMKKRQDRTAALQIPDSADSGALLALGNYEMRCGNFHIAIGFVDKVVACMSHACSRSALLVELRLANSQFSPNTTFTNINTTDQNHDFIT